MDLKISVALNDEDRAACVDLRRIVFIDEQGVSEDEEMDGRDDACIHVLARTDGAPVGAARFQYLGDTVKIQRVCVPAEMRGRGIGAAVVSFIVDKATQEKTARFASLGAQLQALEFYRKLGFSEYGDAYLDAGIPHRDMKRALT